MDSIKNTTHKAGQGAQAPCGVWGKTPFNSMKKNQTKNPIKNNHYDQYKLK